MDFVSPEKWLLNIVLNNKYDDEWKSVGDYYFPFSMDQKIAKRNYPIPPRENLLRLFKGQKPVYMPVTREMLIFTPRIIPDNVVRAFSFESVPLPPNGPPTGGEDMFGVMWDYIPVTGGSMVRPGNPKIKDITHWENYITFPNLDEWDWEGCSKRNPQLFSGERANRVWVLTGLNERLISFMDFDKAMYAYIDDEQKEGVHRLYDRLCVFYDELFERYKKYFNCDFVMFNDDWGTQRGPQFSPVTAREMLVPYMKRIAESCHKRDMYLELHCCGRNDIIAPVIAESGVDMWQPQEINDFELLYKLIGDKVILSIPSDATPNMSDEECYECAERFMDKFGRYGNVVLNIISPFQHPRISEFLYYLSREAYEKF